MKETLYEFYKLSDQKIEDIWSNGILVVDTNVLLDLYRLGSSSRRDLKKSIDFFGNRIWIPYQVGLEFQRNRKKVIEDLGGSKYEEFKQVLNEKVVASVKNQFDPFRKHPCIDYSYIEKALAKFVEDLNKKAAVWEKSYPFKDDDDDILKWVTKKYKGKVGDDFAKEELLNVYNDGKVRYQAQIPPGYKDQDNKEKKDAGLRYLYGDLIIWLAVIKKAKEDNTDVIFLTNDNKEDWFEKYKGRTKGPRFELIREFHKETGRDIIILTEAAFLKEANSKTGVEVKKSSIDDAENALTPDLGLIHFGPYNWGNFNYDSVDAHSFLDYYGEMRSNPGIVSSIAPFVFSEGIDSLPGYDSFLQRYHSYLSGRLLSEDTDKEKGK